MLKILSSTAPLAQYCETACRPQDCTQTGLDTACSYITLQYSTVHYGSITVQYSAVQARPHHPGDPGDHLDHLDHLHEGDLN